MIDELIKPALAPEKKLQPPARWLNWWRVRAHNPQIITCHVTCTRCGIRRTAEPGEIIEHCKCAPTYPSKEVAEIAASRANAAMLIATEYVGAYREGERP